jgi:hypothetical protein
VNGGWLARIARQGQLHPPACRDPLLSRRWLDFLSSASLQKQLQIVLQGG